MDPLQTRERILNGPILKTMVVLAWPMMVTSALQSLYNLVDAFWLGRLSTAALAAPGRAWPPGTVLPRRDKLLVATGKVILEILELQPAGC
jgi:methionyl-tRNA formyltransferase